MKRKWLVLCFAVMTVFALSAMVSAEASVSGIRLDSYDTIDTANFEIVPKTESGENAPVNDGVYENAVMLSVTYKHPVLGSNYLLRVQTTDGHPDVDTLKYIDQENGNVVAFGTVYPSNRDTDATYYVYLTSDNTSWNSTAPIVTFRYVGTAPGGDDPSSAATVTFDRTDESNPQWEVNGNTLTVRPGDSTYAFAVENADGTYTRLPASRGDGVYTYTIPDGAISVVGVLLGDMNSDGRILAADAAVILSASVGSNLTGLDKIRGDINNDGRVLAADAASVLSKSVDSGDLPW